MVPVPSRTVNASWSMPTLATAASAAASAASTVSCLLSLYQSETVEFYWSKSMMCE